MGYIGPAPTSGFISNAKERYTGITTAYVDLNHSISSLADVIVWVNYVKQDATNLTLTSSTRITLGGTLVSADIVEVAYLGKAVSTQAPATGQVTNDMLAGSIANSKLANSSITLNGSAVSLGGSASVGFTPYGASAYPSGTQSIPDTTYTKVTLATEWYDSNGEFANSKYTVVTAGNYLISGSVGQNGQAVSNVRLYALIYKNGSVVVQSDIPTPNGSEVTCPIASTVIPLVADDYIELYFRHLKGSALTINGVPGGTYLNVLRVS